MNIAIGKSIIILIISIAFITITGCLGSNNNSSNNGIKIIIQSETYETEGTIDTVAQASPVTTSDEIHFEIKNEKITRIRINLSIDDGDANTDPDHIDQLRMWRETGGEPQGIEEASGGDTPYSASIEFEYTGDEDLPTWWIVEITATCNAGEDTWIGPLIWHGVTDHGVVYQIEANYDYQIEA